MADNKKKLCPDKLFALLPFTAIASLALIISGIVLFSFPTKMSKIDMVRQNYTIEYTHCEHTTQGLGTCDDFLKINTKENRCQCFVKTNLTEYLRGKVFVHCVLEIADQGSNIDNTSVKTFTDEIKNIPGQCDPYNTQESASKTCEAIPDSIFNDTFKLFNYNLTTGLAETNYELRFNKDVRWRLDKNVSTAGVQNKITVSMNTAKNLSARPYMLYMSSFYRNENFGRRYFIFWTQKEVVRHFDYRSRVIEIIALVLGLVLAAASIVLIVIWLIGVKSNTLTAVTADEPNNRVSGTRPEETPLAAHVNNEQS